MNNNDAFKINAFQKFKTHLIVCEDILENPCLISEYAYQQYNHAIKKAYGSVTSWGIISMDLLRIFSILFKLNIYLKSFHFLFIPNGYKSYPHKDGKRDKTKQLVFACVIYLNPELDQPNYTAFYESHDERFDTLGTRPNVNVTSFVGNRFNKCVMYDGNILHSPGNGFGNNIDKPQDIRLVATFFFDAEYCAN